MMFTILVVVIGLLCAFNCISLDAFVIASSIFIVGYKIYDILCKLNDRN